MISINFKGQGCNETSTNPDCMWKFEKSSYSNDKKVFEIKAKGGNFWWSDYLAVTRGVDSDVVLASFRDSPICMAFTIHYYPPEILSVLSNFLTKKHKNKIYF